MDDEARDTIETFHDALNRRDLDALGDLITDDCVFEATRQGLTNRGMRGTSKLPA